jgi:hypothetical protein
MPLSKKQLYDLKKSMIKKDQGSLTKIRKNKTKIINKSINKEESNYKKTNIVRWNFKVNDLVNITYENNSVGLIVSDYEYFSRKLEKNCFFVLVGYTVKMYDGKYLRQI